MSKPLVVSIPHSLGKEEAIRRIKEGVQWAKDKYGSVVHVSQEEWKDSDLAFRVGALGQSATGTVSVTDAEATVSVELPWLLARFAEKAQSLLQRQGHLMLEKK
jgi:hypothetical protein